MTVRSILFCTTYSLLFVSLLSFGAAAANDDDQELLNIIKSVERGWETADGEPFRQHFLDFEGDFAWAIADVEVRATVKRDDRKIHNRGHETFLFRRVDGDWKVVHTHSSSRPVKND